MTILVLGGYGLIGRAISKELLGGGRAVVGLGRSAKTGRALLPDVDWRAADIAQLIAIENWLPYLAGVETVINASGALQNSFKDDVAAVQRDAMMALYGACAQAGVSRVIQISAPDARSGSPTQFYRTKAEADAALKSSTLTWTILRPGLVLSPHAYGGTSLIRMLAAFPLVQPLVLADAPIQTVSVQDVAKAAADAVDGRLDGQDIDLVEAETHTLEEVVLRIRRWLGFAPPIAVVRLPLWLGRIAAKGADLAGWLGWRPALRTTALTVLSQGVTGKAAVSPRPLETLDQTLGQMPATIQERIYARVMLVMPIAIVVLAAFWIASGVIGAFQYGQALAVLGGAVSQGLAKAFVVGGAAADIAVGAALVWRPLTRMACFASAALATGYLIASAVVTPHLWADPLGPMVKVFPAIMLALFVASAAEER